MLLRLLLLLLLAPALALAENKEKLKQFLQETDGLLEEAETDLNQTTDLLGKPPVLGGSLRFRNNLDLPTQVLRNLKGRVFQAMAGISENLSRPDQCALPSKTKVALAASELEGIRAEAALLQRSLRKSRGQVSRALVDPKLQDLADDAREREGGLVPSSYFRCEARVQAYIDSINELEEWLLSSKISGITAELVARHPECAGKVSQNGGLLPANFLAGNDENSPEEVSESKVQLDILVKKLGVGASAR